MFQQKTDINPKRLGSVQISSNVQANIEVSSSVNMYSGTPAFSVGKKGAACQFEYDSRFPRALLTTEMRLVSGGDGLTVFPFVHTYVAKSPKTVTEIRNNACLLHTLGSATEFASSGGCVLERIDLQPDERQYVVVGYATAEVTTVSAVAAIQCKLYLDEYQFAQPSK